MTALRNCTHKEDTTVTKHEAWHETNANGEMTRPGYTPPGAGELGEFIERHRVPDVADLEVRDAGLLLFRDVTQLEISATRIRNLLATGQDAAFLLPEEVLDFIHKEGIYQTGDANDG